MAVMAFDGKIGVFMRVSILALFSIKNLCVSSDIVYFHGGLLGAASDNNIICKLLRGLTVMIMGGYG